MKKKFGKISRLLMVFCLFLAAALPLAACSKGTMTDPTDAIKNEYGNREFTIAFHMGGLDDPIEDIIYTANNMPVLPSPVRVGYVFAGWYMDSSYQVPYVDGILYLYMRDVTLYAKWVKEDLVSNGVYDIEISSSVLEGSVSKGTLTDEMGGYLDFADCILYEEVCIEISDGHKYLKIPYDCGIVENMNEMELLPALKVSDSLKNTAAFLDETKTIANYADTRKTVFLNIDGWDMETPLYLEIKTTNYQTPDLSSSDRIRTITTYTAKIEVSRFIGFSKPFADYTKPLEDGWYLAKSYYRSENNKPNMGSGFNPVYSYLRVKNGKYTLIKEFTPYLGMLGASNTLLNPVTANYYHRLTSFAPIQLYYNMDATAFGEDVVESDYYPATYHGTNYGSFVAEFHADTGKYYAIYDFGTDLTQEKMIMGGITGYMEAASSMGASNQILSLDYRHLTKLSAEDVARDYTPLDETGEGGYAYSETMQYYPGDGADLTERNLTYAALKEYGMGTHLINFFFSAKDLSVPYVSRHVYSSRITVNPIGETAATAVADARYSIAHFSVDAVVFGYDERAGETLYADSLTLQSLGSNAMRETLTIRTGKSMEEGETVSLAGLYAEKVSREGSYAGVSYHAYRVTDGVIDYHAAVNLPETFVYGTQHRNVAVVFEETAPGGGKLSTPVYLTDRTVPTIRRVTDYTEGGKYAVGDQITLPDVRYTWGKTEGNFIGNYFASEEGAKGIHIIRVTKFSVKRGVYTPTFFQCVVTPTTATAIIEKETHLLYELQNEYGERYYYDIVYLAEDARRYAIAGDDGQTIREGDVTLDENGNRKPLDVEFAYYTPGYAEMVREIGRRFTLTVDGESTDFPLTGYTLYTDRISETDIPADEIGALMSYFQDCMNEGTYFYLALSYGSGGDKMVRKFLYNVTFGGKTSANVMDYDAYFIGRKYTAPCNDVYASDGTRLGSASSFSLQAYLGDELVNNIVSARYGRCVKDGYNVSTTFYTSGRFRLAFGYQLNNLGGDTVYMSFVQYFDVLSDKSDVSITFVTDEEHPFADGMLEKRVTYTLGEDMPVLSQGENFLPTDARLFGWVTNRRERPGLATIGGDNFTGYENYNTTNVYLYAVWDEGIRITTEVNGVRKTYSTVYYRSLVTNQETGAEKGAYLIDLSAFVPAPPAGDAASYSFSGWTGGFLGTAVRTDKRVYIRNAEITEEMLVIRPVYKHYITVRFTQPQNYVNGTYVFGAASVLEGQCIENPGYYLRVKGAAGYTFAGWAVIRDSVPVMVDLTKPLDMALVDPESYSVTLVAVFRDSEGSLVW